MRLTACAPAALLFFVSSLAAAQPASAQEREHPAPAGDLQPTERTIDVTFNPLAIAIGRYGGNVEIVAARHHAFVVSGYAQTFSLSFVRGMLPPEARDRLREGPMTAGGEIGYRLYSGSHGAEGLFVGPSFVLTPLVYPRLTPQADVELVTFHAPGAALDIGAQTVTSFGLTIGGGFGVEYLAYALPDDPHRLPIGLEPHWLPRVLLDAGWAF